MSNPGPEEHFIYHVMVPRADVELDDTWHTLGMRGSGSKDLVVTDVFVPDHRAVPTFPTFLGLSPHARSAVYRLPVYSGLPAMLSGSVLGMAESGLKAFIEKTADRRTAHGVSKGENANMQQRVAESTAEITAARRLLEDMCDRFDAALALDQAPLSEKERIQFRWDSAYIVELCRRAIDRLFSASGAHGLYEGNPSTGPTATSTRPATTRSSISTPSRACRVRWRCWGTWAKIPGRTCGLTPRRHRRFRPGPDLPGPLASREMSRSSSGKLTREVSSPERR